MGVLSIGLMSRFLTFSPSEAAFVLTGTIALSTVQVCPYDVSYAVLDDVWSKSMKHQCLAHIGVRHLTTGSWLVGVLVCALIMLFGTRAEASAWASVNFVFVLARIMHERTEMTGEGRAVRVTARGRVG